MTGETGVFILIVTSFVVALFAHALIHGFRFSFILACLMSAAVSTVGFQLLVAWQLGHVEKFALIAMIVSFPITFAIAAVVGGLILEAKRRKT